MKGLLLDPRSGASTGEWADPERVKYRNDFLDEIEELAGLEQRHWKPQIRSLYESNAPLGAGVPQFYQDTRPPWTVDDLPTITLSTTSLMLFPSANWSQTFASDWFGGKCFWMRMFGKMTTAATPGNLTIELRYGTTDNGGVLLATSAALTLVASQTNISWRAEFYVRCRDTGNPGGTNGSLSGSGVFECNTAVIAAGQALVPATAPAAVACDTNSTSGLNVQFKRSGSTAETATVTELVFGALN